MSLLQTRYQIVADAYPDIARKIKVFWGYQEFTDLMHDLMQNTRDHERAGFPFHVVTAFLELQALHNQIFPAYAEKSNRTAVLTHRQAGYFQMTVR